MKSTIFDYMLTGIGRFVSRFSGQNMLELPTLLQTKVKHV